MLKAFRPYFAAGLASGRPSLHQWRQFFALSLLQLRAKKSEVVLRRVGLPFFSVLTAVMGASVMAHVVEVVKEE